MIAGWSPAGGRPTTRSRWQESCRANTGKVSQVIFLIFCITQTSPCNIQQFLKTVKNDIFWMKICDIFLIFAQNIGRGYTLEPPRRGGSNEYPQSMF